MIANYTIKTAIYCGNEVNKHQKIFPLPLSNDLSVDIANYDIDLSLIRKKHAIICHGCYDRRKYTKDGCKLFHKRENMVPCSTNKDVSKDCSKLICGKCTRYTCCGCHDYDLHCTDCTQKIIQNNVLCQYCEEGTLCTNCADKNESCCDECGDQICKICRAICNGYQCQYQQIWWISFCFFLNYFNRIFFGVGI